MFEILVAGSLVAGLVLTTVRGHDHRRPIMNSAMLNNPIVDLAEVAAYEPEGRMADLPCPWCLAPTGESDERCPACGQKFG